jgi:hypothetical protein
MKKIPPIFKKKYDDSEKKKVINNQVNPSDSDLSQLFPRYFPEDHQDNFVPRVHVRIHQTDGMNPVLNYFLYQIATILWGIHPFLLRYSGLQADDCLN